MTKMQMAGFRCGPRNPANRETRGGRKKADVEPPRAQANLGMRRLLSVVSGSGSGSQRRRRRRLLHTCQDYDTQQIIEAKCLCTKELTKAERSDSPRPHPTPTPPSNNPYCAFTARSPLNLVIPPLHSTAQHYITLHLPNSQNWRFPDFLFCRHNNKHT